MPLQDLIQLAHHHYGPQLSDPLPLKGDGSDRQIYRFYQNDGTSLIGIINIHRKENETFVYLTKHFAGRGIPVPKIYATCLEAGCYLMEDLGQSTLAEQLADKDLSKISDRQWIEKAYQQVLYWLPRIQLNGHQGLDYSCCYQGTALDLAVLRKDVQYFRTSFWEYFAAEYAISQELERELEELVHRVGRIPRQGFLYRDFQSRNIMWKSEQPYFIDYQGGCQGALHYDLATLLYASQSSLDEALRKILIDSYLEVLSSWQKIAHDEFIEDLDQFVLIRRLRSLGTYGFLSSQKGKLNFIKAIPSTVQEIAFLLKTHEPLKHWSALRKLFEQWEGDTNLLSTQWLEDKISVTRN